MRGFSKKFANTCKMTMLCLSYKIWTIERWKGVILSDKIFSKFCQNLRLRNAIQNLRWWLLFKKIKTLQEFSLVLYNHIVVFYVTNDYFVRSHYWQGLDDYFSWLCPSNFTKLFYNDHAVFYDDNFHIPQIAQEWFCEHERALSLLP